MPPSNPSATPDTYTLAIQIYGRGDSSLGDGPSHMGFAIYRPDSPTCTLHHIRVPDDINFIYESRDQQPLEDPVLRGRCELNTSLSTKQKEQVHELLSAFGNEERNIPEMGVGNCQDWVADAVTMLESDGAGCVEEKEGEFWRGMINSSAEDMRRRCTESGRRWVDRSPELDFEGVPDARFVDDRDEIRGKGVEKLAQNPVFRERMRALMGGGGSDGQAGEASEREGPVERPFYVSSPFFSRTGELNSKGAIP